MAFRLFDFSGLAGTFRYFSTFRGFSTFRLFAGTFQYFSTFRLFGACTLFKIFLHFSAFRLFGFSGSFPFSPPNSTHTHILNKYYHKSTAAPSLRRPCRLRRVDLTYDSLNDVAGQPTDIRRRHLAIIFRPRALQISAGPKPQTPNPKPQTLNPEWSRH